MSLFWSGRREQGGEKSTVTLEYFLGWFVEKPFDSLQRGDRVHLKFTDLSGLLAFTLYLNSTVSNQHKGNGDVLVFFVFF